MFGITNSLNSLSKMAPDKSSGYEEIAAMFIHQRGQNLMGIGASSVRHWTQTLPPHSTVLDLGCGTGIPLAKVLVDEGMVVYGVDASPTLVKAFQQNFPSTVVACESVEDSSFFNRKFDGIIAWGLLFLLSKEAQARVIQKVANALHTGGKLLFTAPNQATEWEDILTGRLSVSLGAEKYDELLSDAGLSLMEGFEDEGENHYFNAVKI